MTPRRRQVTAAYALMAPALALFARLAAKWPDATIQQVQDVILRIASED
ncbi:MAG: hypothetical protein AAB418_09010 [candidate division NC10 bacterium]